MQSLFYQYDTSNCTLEVIPPQCDSLEYVLLVHCFALCQCTDSNDPITRPRAFCDPEHGCSKTSQTVFKSQRPWQSKKNFKQLSHKSITEHSSKRSVAAPSDHKPAGMTSRWNNLVRCAHRLPQGKKKEMFLYYTYHFFCMLGGERGVGDAGPQNWSEISDPEACNHHHPSCYNRWDPQK